MTESSLAHIPLFASLSNQELQRLAGLFHPVEAPADTILFHEGDLGDRLYIIVDGQLEIISALGTPDERLVGIRQGGDFVGEMSLLTDDGRRTASVRTRTPSQLLELTRADFDALLHSEVGFAYALLRLLIANVRDIHQAMILDLQQQNRHLARAYADLQAAQAQIVAAAEARARIEQELHVAKLIQQQFLPRELPVLPGWQVAAYYQAAGAVGGDFYDFIELPENHMGLVVGDVTGKGVPAALVMATTQSIIRGEALRSRTPGKVLEQTNARLVKEIPAHMYVTCLYAILDTTTGRLQVANAGHNVPSIRTAGGVAELRARGMPLGLFPDMTYEEVEAILEPGDRMVLYSDGLVEARNPQGQIFGFPRLRQVFGQEPAGGTTPIDSLLRALEQFVGATSEPEDDVTLVTLQHTAS